jgi:outer membrane lipoprotein-sorting protein
MDNAARTPSARSRSARWIPAVVVPAAVVAAGIVVPSMAANAEVVLPEKTPQQVLELAASSAGASFSGTVEQTSDLGLPDVSSFQGQGGAGDATSDALELLTGSHTAEVFVDGTDKQRVQVVEDLAERDVVRDGDSVWTWDSASKEASHLTLPDTSGTEVPTALPDGTAVPQTPAELASALLAAVEPTTTVTASDNVKVAGRTAYQVVLTPDDPATLVGSATLTVDSETGVPLKVVVAAKGQADPAVSIGFTAVDFSAPSSDVFAFTPPAGADVTEVPAPTGDDARAHHADGQASERTVLGSGWSTIVGIAPPAVDAGASAPTGDAADDSSALLDQVLTPVDGGKVLQTSVVSVFVGDDGRVWAGAVDADALQAAVAAQ